MAKKLQTDSVGELLGAYAAKAELFLERLLEEPGTPSALAEAMRYCVLGGGKRLRPALVLMAAEVCGMKEPDDLTVRAAVAVELVHCYSLVHDDLPSMDDDEIRRGRATAHVQFGQAMAILTGDALLTRAFGVLAGGDGDKVVPLIRELAGGAGPAGMVAGQVADMELCDVPEGIEGLRYIHLHKTASLIVAAARMGAICASASQAAYRAISHYALSLGLAFQLVDDLLDATGNAEMLGKTSGKDQAHGKRTYAGQLGLPQARQLAEHLTAQAVEATSALGQDGRKLQQLAEWLAERSR